MKRTSLLLAGLVACLMLVSVAAASAMPTEENFKTECTATTANVVGNKVKVKVTGKNVAPSQARFAGCGVVRKVVRGLTKIQIEKPKTLEGYRCTPVVTGKNGAHVSWSCLFRGADTATEIRLKFAYTYVED